MINLDQPIKILKEGGIVIYPTDTAYGIGCRIDDNKAIKRLFKIRRRPKIQATSVLVDSIATGEKYLTSPLPYNVRHLMEMYWPGALTIIYPCPIAKVPSLVRGSGTTLGLRMPNHDTALSLIKGIGVPLLGPSANFHGEVTPYSFEDLDKELIKLVDYVVVGQCKLRQASTVVDCSVSPWKILREGAVKIDETFDYNDLYH